MTLNRRGFASLTALTIVALVPGALGQGGEDPSSCTEIEELPFTATGTTLGFINDTDEVCPYTGSTSPDVYYCYTSPKEQTVSIGLCESGYDTKLYVYDSKLALIGCSDDACSNSKGEAFRSFLPAVDMIPNETYFIAVDGWGGDAGEYEIVMAGPPVPCTGNINGDDFVGFPDLLLLLSNWGPCLASATTAPAVTSTSVDEVFGTMTAHVVDQSGLSIGYTDGVTRYDSYLDKGPTHNSQPEANVWLMTGVSGSFDMDFGSPVTVDSIAIWNKDDAFGVDGYLLFADDEPGFVDPTTLATGNLALQPSQPATPHERIDFTATTARYFRLQILGNHGAAFTGLSELVFRLGCVGDIDGNGVVDFNDLLEVLSNWGPCP